MKPNYFSLNELDSSLFILELWRFNQKEIYEALHTGFCGRDIWQK